MTRQVRTWVPMLVILAGFVVVAILTRPRGTGAALDPNGTGPQGAKALVLLLREYGADVELVADLPDPQTQTALVLSDQLDNSRRRALAAWVEAGHRLVVADPTSELQTGGLASGRGSGTSDITVTGTCGLPELRDVHALDVGPSLMLVPPPVAQACFPHGDGSFIVSIATGRGRVVGLGGAGVWINSRLDHKDNAALAVDLVTGSRVAFLVPARVGGGRRSLSSLVGPRPKLAIAQLVVAFALLAWWRGRRFGRPVPESQPVQIAGSEIVVAVGDLLHRGGDRNVAADQLRDGTRAWLATRAGLAPSAPAEQVAGALSGAVGGAMGTGHITELLTHAPVGNEEELVRLAQSLSSLRTEVTRAPR